MASYSNPSSTTKISIPKFFVEQIERIQLTKLLNQFKNKPLTLITAPAGYGKSSLLASWAEQQKGAWLSLDEKDNDPHQFFEGIASSLRGAGVIIGEISPAQKPQIGMLGPFFDQLLNDLSASPETLIFLDDYHLIHSDEIHTALADFIFRIPSHVHVYLSSRADIPFPLGKLRSQGKVLEIGAPDLRFTKSEIRRFFQARDMKMSPEMVNLVDARTEGWPVALELFALSNDDDLSIEWLPENLQGSHEYIFDYLAEEVFYKQTDYVQLALLFSSHFKQFSLPLCERVFNRMPEITQLLSKDNLKYSFENIIKSNLFTISLDSKREWYRYHQLFSDYLHAKLRNQYPSIQENLIHQSALIFWEDKEYHEAIEYALKLENQYLAGSMISDIAEEVNRRGEIHTLLNWLSLLEDNVKNSIPWLHLWHAHALSLLGHRRTAAEQLRKGESEIEKLEEEGKISDPFFGKVLAFSSAIHATLARSTEDIATKQINAAKIVSYLGDTEHELKLVSSHQLSSVYLSQGQTKKTIRTLESALKNAQHLPSGMSTFNALNMLAKSYILQGSLEQASQKLELAIHIAYQNNLGLMIPHIYSTMADIRRERNDLHKAEEFAQQALAVAENTHRIDAECDARLILARIYCAQEKYDLMANEINFAINHSAQIQPEINRKLKAWQALLLSETLDQSLAKRWMKNNELTAKSSLTYWNEELHLIRVQILLKAGEAGPALEMLKKLSGFAIAGERDGRLLEILILRSIAHYDQGNLSVALELIEEALLFAEPEGYARIFLDKPKSMHTMLGHSQLSYARILEASINAGDSINLLSNRESEILSWIEAGKTDKEISALLNISFNTVIWHNKNIYRKLGVKNRTEAVSRANEMGILIAN